MSFCFSYTTTQSLKPKQYSKFNMHSSGLSLVHRFSKLFVCSGMDTGSASSRAFSVRIFWLLILSRPQPRHSCIWLLTPIPQLKQGRGILLPFLIINLCALQYSSRQDFPHISFLPIFNHGQMLYPLCPLIFNTAFFSN